MRASSLIILLSLLTASCQASTPNINFISGPEEVADLGRDILQFRVMVLMLILLIKVTIITCSKPLLHSPVYSGPDCHSSVSHQSWLCFAQQFPPGRRLSCNLIVSTSSGSSVIGTVGIVLKLSADTCLALPSSVQRNTPSSWEVDKPRETRYLSSTELERNHSHS